MKKGNNYIFDLGNKMETCMNVFLTLLVFILYVETVCPLLDIHEL